MKDEGVADSLIGSRSSFTIAYDKAKDWLKLQGSPVSDYLLEKEPYLWYLFSFREISTLASFAILAGLWMPKVWLKNHVVSYWTWNTRTFFSKVCALFLPSFSYCLLVCQSSDLSGCPFLLLPYPTTRPFFYTLQTESVNKLTSDVQKLAKSINLLACIDTPTCWLTLAQISEAILLLSGKKPIKQTSRARWQSISSSAL